MPNARMLPRLGAAARMLREDAGLRQIDIALAAGCSEAVVSRFENGVRWPADIDGLIQAYAKQLCEPESEIWRQALDLWEH